MYKSAEILTGGLTMKRGAQSTQRTLFDLPGATPKRSRLNLENSRSNQSNGSTTNADDHGSAIQSNLTSANVDSSTSTDQERVYSSSTGQETESDVCLTSVDLETGSSTSEGTTIATSPNDIANTRDCEPVRPMLKQFLKRMISGKLRSFSSQWYAPYPFVEYSIQMDAVFCYACKAFSSSACLY